MKRHNRIHRLLGAVCFMALFFVIGTVGAIENDILSMGQGLIRASIGLLVFAGAGYLGGYMQ